MNYKFFILLLALCGCVYDPPSEPIQVFNNSDSAIYVYFTCADSIQKRPSLQLFENFEKDGKNNVISPNYRVNAYSYNAILTLANRKNFIENCSDKKLKIFFITESIMRTKTWDEISTYQLYKNKTAMTVDELEKAKWIITYNSK